MPKNKLKRNNRGFVRRINIETNSAREIVKAIATALQFEIHETENGISAYPRNNKFIRLADHKTYLQTWVDNNSYNARFKYDIVIEDVDTVGKTDVKMGYDFEVTEIVYKAETVNPDTAKTIAFDINNALSSGNFANNAHGKIIKLHTTHKNQINCNSIMKTNINKVRLTESQLQRVVKESIAKVLNESIPRHLKQAIEKRDKELGQLKYVNDLQGEVNSAIGSFTKFGFNCTSVHDNGSEYLVQIEDNMGGRNCDPTKTDVRRLMAMVSYRLKDKGYETISRWVKREELYGGIIVFIKIKKRNY